MKKWMKMKIILPVVCVIVVAVTFILLFDMKGKTEQASNENQNNVTEENIIPENVTTQNTTLIVEDEDDEIDENTSKNEIVDGSVLSNTTLPENVVKEEVMSNDDDEYSENKQEKAVELVKKHWGTDNSVYYTNESVKSAEEYIVAVRDKSTTEVKHYFKVNISKGTVVIDY